jgi:hypothetical protein
MFLTVFRSINPMRKSLCLIALFIGLAPRSAWAQGPPSGPPASGGGSTQTIDEIRKNYRIHGGPLYLKPSFLLKELGVDTNVFNQEGQQHPDFTFTATPQLDLAVPMARRGLLRATLGTDFVYYARYDTERSIDPFAVVRAEAYAHRLTLFVEDSYVNTRQRPNYEIDLRSRHLQNDLSGGVAVRLTSKLSVEVARRHGETRFDGDAAFFGQRLQETLDHDSDSWSAAVRHKRSPLTTFGVRYEAMRDRFLFSPVRDTDSFRVMPGVEFKPRALISGSAWVGYRSFNPRNPIVPSQAGLVSQLGLSYTLLGATTFGVSYDRDYEYSVSATPPDFVDNSVGLFVRRAVGGHFDVLGNVARHRYDYQELIIPGAPVVPGPRVETTDNVGLNLGYRLKGQTRIGFGASYWTRDSSLAEARGYEGLRFGTTVTYGF